VVPCQAAAPSAKPVDRVSNETPWLNPEAIASCAASISKPIKAPTTLARSKVDARPTLPLMPLMPSWRGDGHAAQSAPKGKTTKVSSASLAAVRIVSCSTLAPASQAPSSGPPSFSCHSCAVNSKSNGNNAHAP